MGDSLREYGCPWMHIHMWCIKTLVSNVSIFWFSPWHKTMYIIKFKYISTNFSIDFGEARINCVHGCIYWDPTSYTSYRSLKLEISLHNEISTLHIWCAWRRGNSAPHCFHPKVHIGHVNHMLVLRGWTWIQRTNNKEQGGSVFWYSPRRSLSWNTTVIHIQLTLFSTIESIQ